MDDATTVWVYWADKGVFKELRRDDARIEWNAPHSPQGNQRVHLPTVRSKWSYMPVADTKQGAADIANQYRISRIAELQAQIDQIRALMVKP